MIKFRRVGTQHLKMLNFECQENLFTKFSLAFVLKLSDNFKIGCSYSRKNKIKCGGTYTGYDQKEALFDLFIIQAVHFDIGISDISKIYIIIYL